MKVVALVCNLVSVVFTCLVILTDGLSPDTLYRVFTVALVLIPLVSFVALLRGPKSATAAMVTLLLNVGVLGAIGWAMVDQYPHPAEPGFWPYVVVTLATPMVTIVAVITGKASVRNPELRDA